MLHPFTQCEILRQRRTLTRTGPTLAWPLLPAQGPLVARALHTSLLNTIFASAVTSYLAAHLASARLIGRQALTGLALAHGYDTAFWWTAGIFAAGAVVGGALLRRGPLVPTGTPSPAPAEMPTVQAETGPARPA